MAKLAIVTLHGMGRTERGYESTLRKKVRNGLKTKYHEVVIKSVFYQNVLQEHQDKLWGKIGGSVEWDELRKFMLHSFSDASGLETNPEGRTSAYTRTQLEIARTLIDAHASIHKNGQLIVVAQSLGGQVFQNFLWDAQKYNSSTRGDLEAPKYGFWSDPNSFSQEVKGNSSLSFTGEEIDFLSGKSLVRFFTTGCNIPLFIGGHSEQNIQAIASPNPPTFRWLNYYDKDDVLGWPLEELDESYEKLVEDNEIRVGNLFIGWTPFSHGKYWSDNSFINPLVNEIEQFC